MFKLLLNVNGIGPKTALTILSKINYSQLLTAVSNNDLELIESLPGINGHMASQILLDLKQHIGKYVILSYLPIRISPTVKHEHTRRKKHGKEDNGGR